MKKYLAILLVALFVTMPFALTSCGNSRAEEAVVAYEKIADEMVEARAKGDFKRQMEITVELQSMQVEYSDIRADRDLNDEQRTRLAEVMKKITAGGYQEMIENMTNQDSLLVE